MSLAMEFTICGIMVVLAWGLALVAEWWVDTRRNLFQTVLSVPVFAIALYPTLAVILYGWISAMALSLVALLLSTLCIVVWRLARYFQRRPPTTPGKPSSNYVSAETRTYRSVKRRIL